MNFFREFKAVKQSLQFEEKQAASDKEVELIRQKKELLKEVVSIVNKGDFFTRKDAREKFNFFIKSGLNFKSTAERYRTSETSIRISMQNASKLIFKAIGKHTLSLINEGYIKEAKDTLAMMNTDFCLKTLFPREVYDKFPEPEPSVFAYDDLRNEIEFLALYSNAGINSAMLNLNMAKLACLIQKVSSRDDAFDIEREVIADYIQGKLSRDEFYCEISKVGEDNL